MTSIADIKERSELATVGPWIATTPYPYHWQVERPSPRGAGVDVVANYLCEADAEFIAHARDDIAVLLGVIDDLSEELAEAKEQILDCDVLAVKAELADWKRHAMRFDKVYPEGMRPQFDDDESDDTTPPSPSVSSS